MAIVRNAKRTPSFVEKHAGKKIYSVEEILDFAQNQGLSILPLDISSLLKLFNIEIETCDMDGISGLIEKRGNNWKVIVHQYDPPKRQRFTLAHELAHFLLHKELIEANGGRHEDVILMRDGSINPIEKQANDFAALLLMPENDIKSLISQGNKTVELLAAKFEVSTTAMHYRLSQLGYL